MFHRDGPSAEIDKLRAEIMAAKSQRSRFCREAHENLERALKAESDLKRIKNLLMLRADADWMVTIEQIDRPGHYMTGAHDTFEAAITWAEGYAPVWQVVAVINVKALDVNKEEKLS